MINTTIVLANATITMPTEANIIASLADLTLDDSPDEKTRVIPAIIITMIDITAVAIAMRLATLLTVSVIGLLS